MAYLRPTLYNTVWPRITKNVKIDTLDALEEHEEHEDDYQTNSN